MRGLGDAWPAADALSPHHPADPSHVQIWFPAPLSASVESASPHLLWSCEVIGLSVCLTVPGASYSSSHGWGRGYWRARSLGNLLAGKIEGGVRSTRRSGIEGGDGSTGGGQSGKFPKVAKSCQGLRRCQVRGRKRERDGRDAEWARHL
jgi:uncharacterized membrane protein YgcG